jgi:hypothetical protein
MVFPPSLQIAKSEFPALTQIGFPTPTPVKTLKLLPASVLPMLHPTLLQRILCDLTLFPNTPLSALLPSHLISTAPSASAATQQKQALEASVSHSARVGAVLVRCGWDLDRVLDVFSSWCGALAATPPASSGSSSTSSSGSSANNTVASAIIKSDALFPVLMTLLGRAHRLPPPLDTTPEDVLLLNRVRLLLCCV